MLTEPESNQLMLSHNAAAAVVPVQVLQEAKKVVARLDKAEKQVQQAHAEDPQRQELANLYSLGQKVTSTSVSHESIFSLQCACCS